MEFKLSLSKLIEPRFRMTVWLFRLASKIAHSCILHRKFWLLKITVTVTRYLLEFVTKTASTLRYSFPQVAATATQLL